MIIQETAYYQPDEVEDFLAHHGVKGMRWGVRRTRRIQRTLDRTNRIARGTASTGDRILGANNFVFTKKGAKKRLERGAYHQQKVLNGRGWSEKYFKLNAINIRDLNYHTKTTAAGRKKYDKQVKRGRIAAAGFLAAYGAVSIAKAAQDLP